MADSLITGLEVRCALDGLNPHKGAGPDVLFPKVLKALNSHIAPVLARRFNLSLQTAQVPEDSNNPSRKKPPHNRPKAIQTHQPHVCRLQNS